MSPTEPKPTGHTLGIELGSTRIKACVIDAHGRTIATGSHAWENELVDGLWSYSIEAAETGLRAAYADLVRALGHAPATFDAIGISAMMHGYLAFDADDELLVPFRTWRNTNTAVAAAALSEALGVNIPLRWSIAHLHQAVLDREPHVARIARITTLAGHVHRALTGRDVLGVGDASGMFPIDATTGDYDATMLETANGLASAAGAPFSIRDLLPVVLTAGADAGNLTAAGAALLDVSGTLQSGAPLCPPEGDAGTGMVATGAIRPRTANVSAGTSIFAMVVLERPLTYPDPDIDLVTTPDGSPVAMVHCNNGSSELGAWMGLFQELAAAIGSDASADALYAAVLQGAFDSSENGLLAYNLLSGEPLVGTSDGRPLIVRTPGSRLTLASFGRAQLLSIFAALSLGMRSLAEQGVALDTVVAHGGLFRTGGVAQRALAASLGAPVAVGESASEGGAWGIALLAAYRAAVADGTVGGRELGAWLDDEVFAGLTTTIVEPSPGDVADYTTYLEHWQAGLAVMRTAIDTIPQEGSR